MAMDARWREDRGEAIQELEGGEAQRGAAGQVRFRQDVEDLVGAAADEVKPFEGKRRPGAIPNEPLEAFPIGSLDTDAGVEAEPTTVIPIEHVLSVVGLKEAVTAKVAQDPFSDCVLEVLQELGGESGGFVEAEVGFWMGGTRIRVIVDPLKESVHYAQMEMVVRIEAGAEAMKKTDRAHSRGLRSDGTGLPERGLEGSEQDVEDGAGGPGPVVEVGPEAFGHGEHELAHRHVGNDMVHQVGCGLGHALGPARGTGGSALAGKRDPVALHLSCTGYNVGFD
jgi:hypothetical protein